MAKRVTDEERIVHFFSTAKIEKVETLLNVINGIVKTRKPQEVRNTRKKDTEQVQAAKAS